MGSYYDQINWNLKDLSLEELESILDQYPNPACIRKKVRKENRLLASYYPIVGSNTEVDMIAEKKEEGIELTFNYDAAVYRNNFELIVVLIAVIIGNILGVLSLLFFNRRNKTNKKLQNSIYYLIHYIEDKKK
jgi:hypothetical protein